MSRAAVIGRMQGVMLAQWQELLRLRDEVLKTSDAEAIHDLRVASRRFRATLGLFEPWLPKKGAAELKKSTRKLTRVLGGLRNIDEALLFFHEHRTEPEAGEQVSALLAKKRPNELARINRNLAELDQKRLDRLVQKAVGRLTKKRNTTAPLPDYFAATCTSLFQPINDLLPTAPSRKNRESRHALRIAIKKWRYFFEIMAPVLERDCSEILALLKEYQTILGGMNDIAEFEALSGALSLSRSERSFVKETLRSEDELLLQQLTGLIKKKPLVYTFPP
ncbi:MAG: CHAD domain-containing protein [Pelobacteraceae bacterium]